MRSFRTEVEKGSRRRAIRSGLVDPKRFVKYDKKCEEFSSKKQTFLIESKGKNVKIHFTWLGQGREPQKLPFLFLLFSPLPALLFFGILIAATQKNLKTDEKGESVDLFHI